MALFLGNPFTTPVGVKIEEATHDTLPSEDWGLNLEICDLINSSEDSAKDAVKAIRKRLTQNPKNYKIVLYTLVVLETCVKNTGHKFHVLVCSKDFVQELVKLIGPKNDPPTSVQEKVLSLIQSWTEAFKQHPELSGVCQVYADLKHKGVEFPPPEADATPIITPSKSASSSIGSVGGGGGGGGCSNPRPAPLGAAAAAAPAPRQQSNNTSSSPPPPPTQQQQETVAPLGLTPEVRSKLEKELAVVESNASVLSDMLTEVTPGQEHADDLQLLQELHAACEAMQKRVVELVARISDDLVTADLLRINDLLNNLFIRYDRHMSKSRAKGSPVKTVEGSSMGTSHRPPPRSPEAAVGGVVAGAGAAGAAASSVNEVALIDLGDDPPPPVPVAAASPQPELLSHQLQHLEISPGKKLDEADFDSFAQSRTLSLDTAKRDDDDPTGNGVANAASNQTAVLDPALMEVATNFDSMERWMSSQPYGSEISSDAFQNFLSERAAAADMLPTISAATGSAQPPPSSAPPTSRAAQL